MDCGTRVRLALERARAIAEGPAATVLEVGAKHDRLLSTVPGTIFVNKDHRALSGLSDARVADAGALPFPDESFERIYAGFLLCSVSNPAAVAAELVRVLQVGGQLISVEHEVATTKVRQLCQTFVDALYMRPRGKCSLLVSGGRFYRETGLMCRSEELYDNFLEPIYCRRFIRPTGS